MLKVTADLYSGRPNPEWTVNGAEAAQILKDLALNPTAAAAMDSGFQGLGNRGLIVEPLSDDASAEYGLPTSFRLANGVGGASGKGLEVAERLVRGMLDASATPVLGDVNAPKDEYDKGLQQMLLDHIASAAASTTTEATQQPATSEEETDDAAARAAAVCQIEVAAFNPGFWNVPAVMPRNNCYNYATNRRTDTFAQPGRASGRMYSAINCAEVGAAAVRDGARQHPNCAPASEASRWYMALVIAPGPGFRDYHWYRRSREGFWGHKPGGTAARNVDNAGGVIVDPRTANRGPYTIFCGFYYAQRRMVVR
jgi:hypothetical protein